MYTVQITAEPHAPERTDSFTIPEGTFTDYYAALRHGHQVQARLVAGIAPEPRQFAPWVPYVTVEVFQIIANRRRNLVREFPVT